MNQTDFICKTMKTEVMNCKEHREEYMGGLREEKWKGKMS